MSIEADTPVLRETPGGWLATSPGDFPRIGVMATTSTEATNKYKSERAVWRHLRDLAVAEPVTNA
jgi:hypothetical protein